MASTADITTIVLVDRGPKAVEASARAHLRADGGSAVGATLTPLWAELRRAVTMLAANHPCLSIELTIDTYANILDRLTEHDCHSPAYLDYLHISSSTFMPQRTSTLSISSGSTPQHRRNMPPPLRLPRFTPCRIPSHKP